MVTVMMIIFLVIIEVTLGFLLRATYKVNDIVGGSLAIIAMGFIGLIILASIVNLLS